MDFENVIRSLAGVRQFRQYGTVHGNLKTMQPFRLGDTLLRHNAAEVDRSAGGIRHGAVFGEYFTIRRSANDLGNVHTSSKGNLLSYS